MPVTISKVRNIILEIRIKPLKQFVYHPLRVIFIPLEVVFLNKGLLLPVEKLVSG
jgi:hypothetical protein